MRRIIFRKIISWILCLSLFAINIQAFAVNLDSEKKIAKLAKGEFDEIIDDDYDTSDLDVIDSGSINSTVKWYFYENGMLEIAGTGTVPSYSSNAPWQSYVSNINTILVRKTIDSIGEAAFSECNNVEKITLPFIGSSRTATDKQALFGIIFGYDVYDGDHKGEKSNVYPTDNYTYSVYDVSGNLISGNSYQDNNRNIRGNGSSSNEYIEYRVGNETIPGQWYSHYEKGNYSTNIHYGGTTSFLYTLRTYSFRVPDKIKTVIITDATRVEDEAFYNCKYITKIVLNNDIYSIGKNAFRNCTLLNSCAIPSHIKTIGQYAFYKDSALTEIDIPNGITRIEPYTFYECSNISRLCLSENTTLISKYAFYGCTSLPQIIIPDSVTEISAFAFAGCSGAKSIVISENAKILGQGAFSGCSSLIEINIPDKVTSIETNVFSGDKSVVSINIGSGIKIIPYGAFGSCTSLKQVKVPNTVKEIDEGAFAGCDSVESIELPFTGKNRMAIGAEAHIGFIFGYTTQETQIFDSVIYNELSKEVTLYACDGNSYKKNIIVTRNKSSDTSFINGAMDDLFVMSKPWYCCQDGIYTYKYETRSNSSVYMDNCSRWTYNSNTKNYTYEFDWYNQLRTYYYNVPTSLKTVTITDATKIEDAAFNNCKNITNIVLNDKISSVGAYSFQNVPWYTNLTEEFCVVGDGVLVKYNGNKSTVTFPESVKYIAGTVFRNNSKISEVTINENITGIGAYAFEGCINLTSLVIPKTVTEIGKEAIPSNCTIRTYQPSVAYDYRSSGRIVLNNSYTSGQDIFYYVVENDIVEIIGCSTSSTEITVPDMIEGKPVQKIGDYGFAGCKSINSITIPTTIKSIGNHAFDGCTGLINATIPTTVSSVGAYAFNNCSSLKNVTISEGVKVIGEGCFYNCISLEEAVVPDSTEKLGAYAFYNCKSMTTATIGIETKAIEDYAFYNCEKLSTVVIGISVASIGQYAFYNCNLERITIPSATKKIGKYAFANNKNLIRATHKKGLVLIDDYAYSGCTKLETVTLLSSLTTINRGVFLDCSSLTSISLPASLSNLGASAFENCSSINKISVPAGITIINDFAFAGCSFLSEVIFNSDVTEIGKSAFSNNAFTSITLPETVEIIEKSAFYSCLNLESIYIPDATKTIGEGAFFGCSSLEEAYIPDDVQIVGDSAFANNKEMKVNIRYLTGKVADSLLENQGVYYVVLDERITDIGNLAFAYCYNLENITYGTKTGNIGEFLFSKNIKTIGSEAFKDSSKLKKLIIPDTIQEIGDNAFFNNVVSIYNPRDVEVEFYNVSGDIAENILKSQKVSHIYIDDGIKVLGDGAFRNCDILETISMPDTIETCGKDVFIESSGKVATFFRGVDGLIDEELYKGKTDGLTCLIFDENINTIGSRAFADTTTVKGILINDTNVIGENAFSDSSSITDVVIKKAGVIGDYAFYNNTASDTVEIGTANNIGKHAFSDSKTLSIDIDTVHTVEDYAFANCISLKEIKIDSIININDYAFFNDIAVKALVINSDLINIGNHAFEECKLIPEIILPETVRVIGEYAFYNCNSLENINIPLGVENIKSHSFFGCASLQEIELPNTVKNIEDYAYYGCVLVNDLQLGNSVKSIGEYAFYNCNKVMEVIIPETVEIIEDYAFRGCSSLTEIYLPDSVYTLGDCVFYACVGLEKAEFGENITSIGDRVFYGCVNLNKLILNGDVDSIHELAFYGAEDTVVYEYDNTYVEEYCDDNGLQYVNLGKGHNHVYNGQEIITDNATCLEDGYKKIYCSVAGCKKYTVITIPSLGHDYGEWQISKEATMYEEGIKTRSCSRCGDIETEVIPMLSNNHEHTFIGAEEIIAKATCSSVGLKKIYCSYDGCEECITKIIPALDHIEGDWVIDQQATCTSDGTEVKKCTLCGKILQSRKIDMINHTWDNGEVLYEANCTDDGLIKYNCIDCDMVEYSVIQAKGHTIVVDEGVSSGCDIDGKSEGSHCSTCGEVIKKQVTIPAYGHTWVCSWSQTDKEATCTEEGSKTYMCLNCGKNKSESIPAKGHVVVNETLVLNTCEKDGGVGGSYCALCGEVLSQRIILEATGHSWNNGALTKPATCTEAGYKTFTCTNCGEKKYEVINAAGHTVATDSAVAATCLIPGKTAGTHCSTCGEIIVPQQITPAKGHTWDEGKVTKEATCALTGTYTFTCIDCGTTKDTVIAAIGHRVVVNDKVEPTLQESGATPYSYCSVCNEILTPYEILPPIPGYKISFAGITEMTEEKSGMKVNYITDGCVTEGDIFFSVECDKPCYIAYSVDGGETYTRLAVFDNVEMKDFGFVMNVDCDVVLAIGLIGDLNLDGKVDSADALQVLRYDVGKTTFDSLQKIAGNINVDSRIDSADALQILRYDVGKTQFSW